MARDAQAGAVGRSNKRMHATRDTSHFIFIRGVGGRVMRGVRSPERGGLPTRKLHPAALRRSNSGMHPTADTAAVI